MLLVQEVAGDTAAAAGLMANLLALVMQGGFRGDFDLCLFLHVEKLGDVLAVTFVFRFAAQRVGAVVLKAAKVVAIVCKGFGDVVVASLLSVLAVLDQYGQFPVTDDGWEH